MKGLWRLWKRLGNVVLGRRSDERLLEEADWHVEMETEMNLRMGLSPVEARRHAKLSFGSVEATRERLHEEEGLPFVENLLLDYRTGVQSLRFSPIFSAVALLNLTIIIAVNVFIFSLGRVLLTGSMGIVQPEQVYQLRPNTWENWKLLTTSLPVLKDLRQRNRSFVDLAGVNGYSRGAMTWAGRGFQAQGEEVTGNYFSLLGVRMQLGTGLSMAAADAATIVLSDDLWRSRFGGDQQVVGKMVLLGREFYRIAGVAPAAFHGTERLLWPDYWTRMELPSAAASVEQRTASSVTILGRLREDATPQSAVSDLDTISRQLAKSIPAAIRQWRIAW